MTLRRDVSPKVCGVLCAVCLFFLLTTATTARGAEPESYATQLVAEARRLRLAEDGYWRSLLHITRRPHSRTSIIDDPRFFLASDGKENPGAELEATLHGMFSTPAVQEEDPRCRFPARISWLKERLAIDESRLPAVSCGQFQELVERLHPQSAALIFPAAFMNNPASMFGHTLLRIDGGTRSDLLAYALNYAAQTDETNGFVYAFKGIFGRYRGYYSLLPYYAKVWEYNDLEHRDMWEYRLDFTPREVYRMVEHIWELKEIYSDYFFFDENCSFNLLYLLESARPGLELTSRARTWVIPSDTIRVVRESGLITGTGYRPSQARKMNLIATGLDNDAIQAGKKLAARESTPRALEELQLSRDERRRILDLAAEMLQHRYGRRELTKEEYLPNYLAILRSRSALGSEESDSYAVPVPAAPEQGHRSARFNAGLGLRNNSTFLEFGGRPAYHGILDPGEGYLEGSQIQFADLRLRYFSGKESLRLESLHLIDIVSYSPRERIYAPFSWKVATGFDRGIARDGEDRLLYRLATGSGISFHSELLGLFYLMADADLNLAGHLRDSYSLGVGVSAGIIRNLAPWWKINLLGEVLFYRLGDNYDHLRFALAQNFRTGPNTSLDLALMREATFNHYRSEIRAGWNYYF